MADRWITRILSYQGIDKDALAQKRINWLASVAVTSMVLVITLSYHYIFPQLRILIWYGLFLTVVFMQGVIYPIIFRRTSRWLLFVDQTLVALATLAAILLLGGIPWSGGLVMVGFALIFFSLNFRRKGHSIAIYVIYVITVLIAGLLHPRLTVPPEMTAEVNISLWVINVLWITGFAMIFVLNFISQRIRLEQLEAARLREVDEARKRLYASISHEFRTPLTVITGMNDLISTDPERWLRKGSKTIERNVSILLNLVDQMLDLAKLEAKAMPVSMIRADVSLCIRHAIELFRSFAESKGIDLEYVTGHDEMVLDYDADKIMKVVSNLLTNALKFTQPGGKVVVSTDMISVDRYEIRVSDNGPGITEGFLPFVFERFTRESGTTAGKTPGTGLGLALTKELVTLMGGTVRVESIYGEGAEFIVTLPVTRSAEKPGEAEKTRVKERSLTSPGTPDEEMTGHPDISRLGDNNPILLIVEDNEDVIRYLMTILSDDYAVTAAADGAEGFNMATKIIPDIIITDVMMPVMDGVQMLDLLKNDPRTSHIPVVILTARADVASRIDGLARGADAYIAKPFDREELRAELKMLIKQRRLLHARYSTGKVPPPDDDHRFRIEDSFMRRINEVMTEHLGDDDFDINNLCEKLNLSRTQLYRKFRSLTSESPHDYFLKMKLRRARSLLTSSDLTVAEAAYRAGFKNVSHFSKAFTREFGINPSDIRK